MQRSDVMSGITIKQKTGCGNMYITINSDGGKISEFFAHLGKAGTCARAYSELCGRLIGIGIKKDIDIKNVIKSIRGINCNNSGDGSLSCPDAFANALETYLKSRDTTGDSK